MKDEQGKIVQAVYVAASAVLAIHILMDSFVDPRPGTSPTDHLVPGLVPVAIVALGVWLFPRLGRPLQAALALVLGAITLLGSGVALRSLADGIGGDDITGILLVPAGLALVGLGVWLLWKARRRDGHRVLRAALLVVGVVLGAYFLVLPMGMAIIATHRPAKAPPEVTAAALGRPARAITVRTDDGVDLHGWYVSSRNGAAVLTFPREWTAPQARILVKHGYGVLLLDMRGYGDSEGDPNAFGWGSTADVKAGVAFLERQADVKNGQIGGLGLSVGGEQMLETAAIEPGLKAVVSEGAGERSVRESVVRGPKGWAALPSMAVQTTAVAVLSGEAPPPALQDLVARIAPRPVLLIYAEHGAGGEELTPEYLAAAQRPKESWMVPGSGHTGGLRAQPAEYEQRVIAFFDRALLGNAW